ncbi:MAG: ScyD/ScyE family protein [Burkholderiales bacterium]|nr:ScyD/ScyE family protein [Anaerolineae bacterium]
MVRKTVLGLMLALGLALPVMAQDAPPAEIENAIVSGLNFPRGIAYSEDGTLYIAEAGAGGEATIIEIEGMAINGGVTSQVTTIAPDGTQGVAVGSLTSAFVPMEGAGLGLQRAIPAGDSLWLVLSDHQNLTVFSDAIVEIDTATLRVKNYIELFAYEAANNPDGTEEIYSNPSDIAWGEDGTLFIIDTGANALYSWTEADGLQLVHAWTDLSVPVAIEMGVNGDIYVGFLGEGIAPGAAKVEHWAADGSELIETFDGLTAVTDILVTEDDTIYAVQLAQLGEQGPVPNSGSVVTVSADGITPVAEGLSNPFGIAQNADGELVVSVNSAFAAPGSGAVVTIAAE